MTSIRPTLLLPLLAALAGAALLSLAVTASKALRERDRLVVEGILLRAGHELEADLRVAGPEGAGDALAAALAGSGGRILGASVEVHGIEVAEAGELGSDAVEIPAALGPGWRELVAGRGPGRGKATGGPPFRIRLAPGEAIGGQRAAARALLVGSLVAALLLVFFAALGARGIERSRRLAAAEAEQERLETVARAGAGLAHRIGSPLAAIKGTAQMIASRSEAATRERAERIVEASGRIEDLVRQLLGFARPVEPEPGTVDLLELVRGVREGLGAEAPAIRDATEKGSKVVARVDRSHATAIVEELLANARRAGASTIELRSTRLPGRRLVLELADDGSGLDAQDPESLFEPYVTTRADGTGLGLPTVRTLARANGGELRLRSGPGGKGAVALLELPEAED